MSTVDKTIADRFIAGEWPEDRFEMVLSYKNAWGGVSYKLCKTKEQGKEYLENPPASMDDVRLYWESEE